MSGFGFGFGFSPLGALLNHLDWEAYWLSLISATVENAAPTHVVLTFPEAQSSLVNTDFTIAGFTIVSSSWAGSVLTLVLLYPVTSFSRNLTITFLKTLQTSTVTNNVTTTSVAWFKSADGSSTYVTKGITDLVSVWKDLSGNNRHLNQANETKQPTWKVDGILFPGVDEFLKTTPFTFNRPEEYFIVLQPLSWTDNDRIIDGDLNNSAGLFQSTGTPDINISAGGGAGTSRNSGLTLTDFHILRLSIPASGSVITQIDNNVPVDHGVGASSNAGGITLAKYGGADAGFAHMKVKELIVRNSIADTPLRTAIYNYFAYEYGFFLITT